MKKMALAVLCAGAVLGMSMAAAAADTTITLMASQDWVKDAEQ